jgi:hypothetical protein
LSEIVNFPEPPRPHAEASRVSRCELCDELIHEGDDIVLYEDEWCHEECVEIETEGEDVQ